MTTTKSHVLWIRQANWTHLEHHKFVSNTIYSFKQRSNIQGLGKQKIPVPLELLALLFQSWSCVELISLHYHVQSLHAEAVVALCEDQLLNLHCISNGVSIYNISDREVDTN